MKELLTRQHLRQATEPGLGGMPGLPGECRRSSHVHRQSRLRMEGGEFKLRELGSSPS